MENFKPFWEDMEKIAQSTNAGLRTEAMNFYKEATKWIGFDILNVLKCISKLKQVQQDEIENFCKTWDKTPMVPLQFTAEEYQESS